MTLFVKALVAREKMAPLWNLKYWRGLVGEGVPGAGVPSPK